MFWLGLYFLIGSSIQGATGIVIKSGGGDLSDTYVLSVFIGLTIGTLLLIYS